MKLKSASYYLLLWLFGMLGIGLEILLLGLLSQIPELLRLNILLLTYLPNVMRLGLITIVFSLAAFCALSIVDSVEKKLNQKEKMLLVLLCTISAFGIGAIFAN